MRLLFTGADSYLAKQIDPVKSLGGHISSSIIPNGKMNNLFSDISYITQQDLREEIRAIVLENKELQVAEDVLIGYEYDSDNFEIEIAFVSLDNNEEKMELLSYSDEEPYDAIFYDARKTNEEDKSVNIGNLGVDSRMGIWLKRKMKKTSIPIFQNINDEIEYWKTLYDKENQKEINLTIKYKIDVP